MRCGHFRLRIVATDITIAEVIGEDDEDVRARRRGGVSGAERADKATKRGKDEVECIHMS